MKFFLAIISLIITIFFEVPVQACSTCFGDPNSLMAKGVNSAVLLMLGVVGVVLGLFIVFLVYFWRRSKNLDSSQ